MTRLKILLLSHFFYPHIGGIETVSELLANQFSFEGHEVVVITWSRNELPDHFSYRVIRHPTVFTLIKFFLWSNIVFENNLCLRLSWPRFFLKKPNIITLQTWFSSDDKKKDIYKRLKLKKLALANKVIAISKAVKEKLWLSAVVIPNPYDEKVFKLTDSLSRKNDFVFVGRLVSDKGVNYAIKAIHNLITDNNNLFNNLTPLLTIIGDGNERLSLENLAVELGIKDYIYFTGALQKNEIAKELNKHTFLLVPSVWEEPFGIVVLEGMACGCIPIISDSGGLPEAGGHAAVTFKNKSLPALINSINSLMRNTELQGVYRHASVTHLQQHSAIVIAKKYLTIFQEILKNQNS